MSLRETLLCGLWSRFRKLLVFFVAKSCGFSSSSSSEYFFPLRRPHNRAKFAESSESERIMKKLTIRENEKLLAGNFNWRSFVAHLRRHFIHSHRS